jgi:hypothetical protein
MNTTEAVIIALLLAVTFLVGGIIGLKFKQDDFGVGNLKVYSWSNVEQLNAELAKGYTIESTYNVTNMVLRKVSK